MRTAIWIGLVGVLCGACLGAELPVAETPVGHLALPVVEGSMVVSPDSSRLAFATKAGDATLLEKGVVLGTEEQTNPANDSASVVTSPIRLYLDAKMGVAFDMMTPAVFSPDSKRVAYAGKFENKWRVVIDNKIVEREADELPGNPIVFSPDSAHVAWVMKKGDEFFVTMDDKQWPGIKATAMGMPEFSPNSQHVAAVARMGTNWLIYVDGAALASPGGAAGRGTTKPTGLERFGQLVWRPDSSGLGFCGAMTGGKWQVFSQSLGGTVDFASKMVDGVAKGPPPPPAFSADGKHLAFGAAVRNKWSVVSDGGENGVFDQILPESVRYYEPAGSDAGKATLLYAAQLNRKWQLYVDHQAAGDTFDGIINGSFLISPDRHHYVFAGTHNAGGQREVVVIKDGQLIATHVECGGGTFAFSPDSQHVAYAARSGATGGGWSACVDGQTGAGFAALAGVPVAFSPDSRRVAYLASMQAKTWHVVVGLGGELQSKAYDAFLKGSKVAWGPGGVTAIAIQKKVATRVVARP